MAKNLSLNDISRELGLKAQEGSYEFSGLGLDVPVILSQSDCIEACKTAKKSITASIKSLLTNNWLNMNKEYRELLNRDAEYLIVEKNLMRSLYLGLSSLAKLVSKSSENKLEINTVDTFIASLLDSISTYFIGLMGKLSIEEKQKFMTCYNKVSGGFYLVNFNNDGFIGKQTKTYTRDMPYIDEKLKHFNIDPKEAKSELYRMIDTIATANDVSPDFLREAVDLGLSTEQLHAVRDLSIEKKFSPKFGTFAPYHEIQDFERSSELFNTLVGLTSLNKTGNTPQNDKPNVKKRSFAAPKSFELDRGTATTLLNQSLLSEVVEISMGKEN